LGVWEAVEPKLAQAENVRAALAFVAQGEAPFGIVYATDAGAEDNVTVGGDLSGGKPSQIVYPGALVAGARSEAAAFLDHLSGPEARAAFRGARDSRRSTGRMPTLAPDEWQALALSLKVSSGRRRSACRWAFWSRWRWRGDGSGASRSSTGWCICR
jgi:hypothetical protein